MTEPIVLDTRRLDEIVRKLGISQEAFCRRIAFEIEQEAKMLAPIDTGALRNSIYTVTNKEDGYADASAAAREANEEVQTSPLPAPAGDVIARVGPCVDYAGYVEFMGPRAGLRAGQMPFLLPAVENIARKVNSGEYAEELKLE